MKALVRQGFAVALFALSSAPLYLAGCGAPDRLDVTAGGGSPAERAQAVIPCAAIVLPIGCVGDGFCYFTDGCQNQVNCIPEAQCAQSRGGSNDCEQVVTPDSCANGLSCYYANSCDLQDGRITCVSNPACGGPCGSSMCGAGQFCCESGSSAECKSLTTPTCL